MVGKRGVVIKEQPEGHLVLELSSVLIMVVEPQTHTGDKNA